MVLLNCSALCCMTEETGLLQMWDVDSLGIRSNATKWLIRIMEALKFLHCY